MKRLLEKKQIGKFTVFYYGDIIEVEVDNIGMFIHEYYMTDKMRKILHCAENEESIKAFLREYAKRLRQAAESAESHINRGNKNEKKQTN